MWRWFKSLFKKNRGLQIENIRMKDHIPSDAPYYNETTDTLDLAELCHFTTLAVMGYYHNCDECSRKCDYSNCMYANGYAKYMSAICFHEFEIRQLKIKHNFEIDNLKIEYENKMRESQVNNPTQITYGETLKKSDDAVITRSSKKYREFRKKVLKRDEVCQCCGANEDLVVHHIDSYKINKQKRADTTNGVVLCEECHRYYHSLYGTREGVNPFNFAKFMRDYSRTPQTILEGSIVQNNDLNLIEGGN